MTTLIIARHGNTFSPFDTVTYVGGRTDLPLVESGIEQAKAIGRFLKASALIPDAVYCSTLQRTRQTAEIAIKESGVRNPAFALDIFNEIDYGPDENKTREDIVARIGENALKDWDERSAVPPGWNFDAAGCIEHWKNFADHIHAQGEGEIVLVVTSNGIARFAPHITGDYAAFATAHAPKMTTGAVSIFDFKDQWILREWNFKP
jgi:2,3-bisphosphoglycerate-dependent phosphoglycerate mutase